MVVSTWSGMATGAIVGIAAGVDSGLCPILNIEEKQE